MMKTRSQLANAALRALDALDLGALTHADRKRLSTVRLGLRALDDEQAEQAERVDRLRSALKTCEPKPVWRECLCSEISKSDRPCIVCQGRRQWYADRGTVEPLTAAQNAFFLKETERQFGAQMAKGREYPLLTAAGLISGETRRTIRLGRRKK